MANPIQSVRVFAGTIKSEREDLRDIEVPATLTLIERDQDYEFRFVMFVCGPLALNAVGQKSGSETPVFQGIAKDPRGWDVICRAHLVGNRIMGSYDQPQDKGSFALEEV